MLLARGLASPETTEAFARVREATVSDKDGRLVADYGLWVGSIVRGELSAARVHANAFLADVGATPDSPEAGVAYRAASFCRGVELRREQSVLLADGQFKILLAEVEARSGDVDCALSIVDEALATSDRVGHRYFDAELRRAHGEMLLKRDRTDPEAAEQALLNAIAIAREQGTRSFELRAALSLAKLYQSTGRPADAHSVLAPAVVGFAPTPEMPEIAEAQALIRRLA
jgi:predicted ATPase